MAGKGGCSLRFAEPDTLFGLYRRCFGTEINLGVNLLIDWSGLTVPNKSTSVADQFDLAIGDVDSRRIPHAVGVDRRTGSCGIDAETAPCRPIVSLKRRGCRSLSGQESDGEQAKSESN